MSKVKGSEAIPVVILKVSISVLSKKKKILSFIRKIDTVDRLGQRQQSYSHHLILCEL